MALTDSVAVFAEAVFEKLLANQATLGLQDTWYGDQEKIPRTPCQTVEAGTKHRELNGAPRRTLVSIEVYVMVYHDQIQDVQANARAAQARAEQVEAVLHSDPQWRTNPADASTGLVIHSFVTANEPGYVRRNNGSLMSASRLTLTATSQVQLPYNIGG